MFDIPRARAELRMQFVWIAGAVTFLLLVPAVSAMTGQPGWVPSVGVGWAMALIGLLVIVLTFFCAPPNTGMVVLTTILMPTLAYLSMARAAMDVATDAPRNISPFAFFAVLVLFAAILLLGPSWSMAERTIGGLNKRTQTMFFVGYALTPLSAMAWYGFGPGFTLFSYLPYVGLVATLLFFHYLTPRWLEELKANRPLPQSQNWDVVEP